MQRTAEEFVHELPNGRWFVGDFVGIDRDGYAIFLVELRPGRGERGLDFTPRAGQLGRSALTRPRGARSERPSA